MVMTTLYVMCSLTKSCDIDKKLHEIKDFSPDNLQQCTVCKYDLFWDGHGEVATVLLCVFYTTSVSLNLVHIVQEDLTLVSPMVSS